MMESQATEPRTKLSPCSVSKVGRDTDKAEKNTDKSVGRDRASPEICSQTKAGTEGRQARGEDKDQQVSAGACREREGGSAPRELAAEETGRNEEKQGQCGRENQRQRQERDRQTCQKESERSAQKRNRLRERPAEPSLECD